MEAIKVWLTRFRIAHKLLFASAVLAVPILALLYSVASGYSSEIRMARNELAGAQMLEPLRRMSEEMRRHQRVTYLKLKNDLHREPEHEDSEKKADQALAEFLRVSNGTAKTQAAAVSTLWNQIKSRPPATVEEHTAIYDQLAAGVSALVREVGDSTSLVLDPELQTYYLAELAVADAPRSQDTIADAAILAMHVSLEQQISQRDLMRFEMFGEALDSYTIGQVRHATEIVRKEDLAAHGPASQIQQNLPPLVSRYEAAVAASAEQFRRYAGGTDANATPQQIATLAERAETTGADLWRNDVEDLRATLERRLTSLEWKRALVLIGAVLALGIAWLVVTLIARNITTPLDEVVKLARDISAGSVKEARGRLDGGAVRELLAFPDAKDEICQLIAAIAHMTGSLDSLLAQVGSAGTQVAGSAAQITEAVRELETTVTEQAASTTEVNATSREIFASVQELAKTMEEVSRVAQGAVESASACVHNLEQIRVTMRSLTDAGEGLSAALATVSEKARNVDEVTVAITKVANRTNLLSLNAAIEAERAGGDAGGFAVLAIEIRRLADQTAVAALDIEKLIQEMQAAVRDGVSRVEQYADEARASSRAIASLSAELEVVITNTRQLGPEFENVNQAMQGQAQGAGRIAESMTGLRDAAHHTRDSLAGFRRVSDQLHDAVNGLQAEVGRFSEAAAK
jgi:methyl-accepting chemotaxis protein